MPMRVLNSLTSSAIRSVVCRWLASWKSRLLWPSKKTGTTAAPDFAISRAVKRRQEGSIGRPKGFSAVETVPPGKMPMQPPAAR